MKIFGIGTDIVEVKRIKKSLKKKSFNSRLFHKNEILKCKNNKKSLGNIMQNLDYLSKFADYTRIISV